MGGCWSFYREHTHILVFGKKLSIFARGKKWILPFGIVSHLKDNGCLIPTCEKFPQWGSNYMKIYTFLFRKMQTLGRWRITCLDHNFHNLYTSHLIESYPITSMIFPLLLCNIQCSKIDVMSPKGSHKLTILYIFAIPFLKVKLQKEVLEGFGAFCHLLWTLENIVEICGKKVQFIMVKKVTKMAMPWIFGLNMWLEVGRLEKQNNLVTCEHCDLMSILHVEI